MVKGPSSIEFFDGVCEGCGLGKHPQEKFGNDSYPLDFFHIDVMWTFLHPAMSKDIYVLPFLDDDMRYTWVHFLKLKYEVFDLLKIFKAHVEKQSGKMIKILCIDNAGSMSIRIPNIILMMQKYGCRTQFFTLCSVTW